MKRSLSAEAKEEKMRNKQWLNEMVQYDNQRIHKDEQQKQTSFTYSRETSLLFWWRSNGILSFTI